MKAFFKKWIFIFNNKFKYNKHHKSINNLKNCFNERFYSTEGLILWTKC